MPEPHSVRVSFVLGGTSRNAGAEGDALGHMVSLTQEDTVAVLCPHSMHTEDGMHGTIFPLPFCSATFSPHKSMLLKSSHTPRQPAEGWGHLPCEQRGAPGTSPLPALIQAASTKLFPGLLTIGGRHIYQPWLIRRGWDRLIMARNLAEGKTRDVVASEGTPAAGSIALAQQPAAQKWNYGARSYRESILEALIEVLE